MGQILGQFYGVELVAALLAWAGRHGLIMAYPAFGQAAHGGFQMVGSLVPPLILLIALAQNEEQPVFTCTQYAFEKAYTSSVSSAQILSTPRWNQADEDCPPISPRRALKLAKKMRDSMGDFPKGLEWECTQLTLQPYLGSHIWLVTYAGFPAHDRTAEPGSRLDNKTSGSVTFIVLMDGKTIKPEGKESDGPPELPPPKSQNSK